MEFPSLGEHCQDSGCNQTDFLPLKCVCGGVFCREHFTAHCLSTGCGLRRADGDAAPRNNTHEPDPSYLCASACCGRSSLHELLCSKCQKHFCIEHRFHPECPEVDEETLAAKREEIAAPRRQFQHSNVPLQQQITENIRKALKSTPKAKTAAKIQLMRIKQKAIGPKTIPAPDRAYFSIVKPKDFTAKAVIIVDKMEAIPNRPLDVNLDIKNNVSIFVSKKWSLGRAVDAICETCSIANYNNEAEANKVRLFRQSDGYCAGEGRLEWGVGELLAQELLVEGESLVMEYVASDILAESDGRVHAFLKLPVESLH